MGGNMPPPNMQMGGPPRHPVPGRKTLLNTPNMPPPHRHPHGGPGGRPPQGGRDFDGPMSSHGHPPERDPAQYRSQPDHFGGPPKHGGDSRGRDLYHHRDSYGGGPPQERGGSYSAPSKSN